ncbi:MAG: hypothetical protein AB7P08_05125 [Burkholderiales bacterium]
MNADVTPMNADEAMGIGVPREPAESSPMSFTRRAFRAKESSAFIGVTSAFIGVPKNLASVSP